MRSAEVLDKVTGLRSRHFAVDAREMAANDPARYELVTPLQKTSVKTETVHPNGVGAGSYGRLRLDVE